MTQKERVIEWFKQNTHLNPLQAWKHLGIYRLGDVIFRLKKDLAGTEYEIVTERMDVENRFREKCNVGNYHYRKISPLRDFLLESKEMSKDEINRGAILLGLKTKDD
jgi:Helix-turn-helix domain